MSESETRSVPQLIGDLAADVSNLVRTEGKLLRAELSEKATQFGTGAGEVVAGALCLFAALLVMLQAVIVGLTNLGLGAGWASLLVGVVVAGIGAALLMRGIQNVSPSGLAPERIQEQLRQDADAVKEQIG